MQFILTLGSTGIFKSGSWIVLAYINPVTRAEKAFTKAHESKRKEVERLFGVVQSRFKMVRSGNELSTPSIRKAKQVISACFLLHNMIIKMCGSSAGPTGDVNEQGVLLDHHGLVHEFGSTMKGPLLSTVVGSGWGGAVSLGQRAELRQALAEHRVRANEREHSDALQAFRDELLAFSEGRDLSPQEDVELVELPPAPVQTWCSAIVTASRDRNSIDEFLRFARANWEYADPIRVSEAGSGVAYDPMRRELHARATDYDRYPPYHGASDLEATLQRLGVKLAVLSSEPAMICNTLALLRAGCGDMHDPTRPQYEHRDMTEERMNDMGGAHIFFLAGSAGSKLNIQPPGGDLQLLHLRPYEMLTGPGFLLHAGSTHQVDNDMIYFVIGHDKEAFHQAVANEGVAPREFLSKVALEYHAGELRLPHT